MDDQTKLRLPLPDFTSWEDLCFASQEITAQAISHLLSGFSPRLPKRAADVEIFCTHFRPHLDEYLAMLLFRSCLPREKWHMPIQETVIQDAKHDKKVCADWEKACVFGLGNVQTGGANPLLVFDEHTQAGRSKDASSAIALVTKELFGSQRLPQALFFLSREIDIVDACGGAHPKHLTTYLVRLHDASDSPLSYTSLQKQTIIEACLIAIIKATDLGIRFWENSFWHEAALCSLQNAACSSPLRTDQAFEKALLTLSHNIDTFRQPFFSAQLTKQSDLFFASKGQRIFQCIVIPFIAALLPLVFGETNGAIFSNALWNARLLGQMRYNDVYDALESQLGSEPKDCEITSSVGHIIFRETKANSENDPWIIDMTPAHGMGSVRQALISFTRKYHKDCAYVLLRNSETNTLVLSRGHGVPMEQWNALIKWLLEWEGSSDADEEPGCWHEVTSASGVHADFILNGNAAHRYVPPTKLNAEILKEWIESYCAPR